MHVLPRVGELHARFPDHLEVIGVHAGKFVTERRSERIEDACARLGVNHPVVNDRQFRTWREYGVQAWPTIAVIDPEGYLVGLHSGEVAVTPMAEAIEKIARRAEERGTLRRGPGVAVTMRPQVVPGVLRYPTRALIAGGRVWVADTGNGRVLECEWAPRVPSARIVREIGGFVEPRGLAWFDGALFVADRRDQSIWRIDGEERARVAGTGVLAGSAISAGPSQTPLRSPWGLASMGDRIAVAMAGSHQLWTLDPAAGRLALLAGGGGEELADGPAERALLAQPTGVALGPAAAETASSVAPSRASSEKTASAVLAFADSETSAARILRDGRVLTLAGTGLFEFGDRPGVGDEARMQHGEDVAWHRGVLAVADTYNDRLKLVDPTTRECVAWPGEAGEPGALREPGGVFSDGENLLVSDTGKHRIVRVEDDGSLAEVRFS